MSDFFSNLDSDTDPLDAPAAKPDALASLIDAPKGEVRTSTKPITYLENCPSCRGTGVFRGYSGRTVGPCFKCKGKKTIEFRTSPEARAAHKARAYEEKAKKADAQANWIEAHTDVIKWIGDDRQLRSNFAQSLLESFRKYHKLSENQVAAVRRIIAENAQKEAARKEEAKRTAPVADEAGVDRLKAAFDRAAARASEKGVTIRTPRIVINGITISPAKSYSANAGALYVKMGGEYLGKIMEGRFFRVRACTDEQEKSILAFLADPKKAAEAYGQETGVCCVCNATLKSAWRLKGIGPICAEKMGWAGE